MATASILLTNRTTRLSYLLGTVLLVCAPESGSSQTDLFQLPPNNSPAQQLVSKNELLTPAKAQREFERAHKDFLHQHYDAAQEDVQRGEERWLGKLSADDRHLFLRVLRQLSAAEGGANTP